MSSLIWGFLSLEDDSKIKSEILMIMRCNWSISFISWNGTLNAMQARDLSNVVRWTRDTGREMREEDHQLRLVHHLQPLNGKVLKDRHFKNMSVKECSLALFIALHLFLWFFDSWLLLKGILRQDRKTPLIKTENKVWMIWEGNHSRRWRWKVSDCISSLHHHDSPRVLYDNEKRKTWKASAHPLTKEIDPTKRA